MRLGLVTSRRPCYFRSASVRTWVLSVVAFGVLTMEIADGRCSSESYESSCWVNRDDVWSECKNVDATACSSMCGTESALSLCVGKMKENDGDDKEVGPVRGSLKFEHVRNGAVQLRTYDVFAPPEGGAPKGMVVVLGYGCMQLQTLAHSEDLLVVCPFPLPDVGWRANVKSADDYAVVDGTTTTTEHDGNGSDDVEFIAELVTELVTSRTVPADRVLVTGFSNGGSMAYRVLCERSDVVGGIVPYGQTFLEPASGQVPKGEAVQGGDTSLTVQALQRMTAARQGPDRCDPHHVRPHRAVVGTADVYYGADAGVYDGLTLWAFFSTEVYNCTGNPIVTSTTNDDAVTGKPNSTCYHYPSCPGLANDQPGLNRYCTVPGWGHDVDGWEVVVARAFDDFFVLGDDETSDASYTVTSAFALTAISLLVTVLCF